MFIPLTHAPGEAQAHFGEALVVVAGVEQKAHYLTVELKRRSRQIRALDPILLRLAATEVLNSS
jgi:hypothetical protein